MKPIYSLLLFCLPLVMLAQSQDQNYVRTTTYQEAVQENETTDKVIDNITYVDGLGRPIQTKAIAAGGNKQDLVTPTVYDFAGRNNKEYLPYADPNQTVNSLDYIDNTTLITNQATYYQNKFADDFTGTINPYAETQFEASPLNRPLKQGAPGSDWAIASSGSDHSTKMDYKSNTTNEVRYFEVTHPGGNTEEIALSYVPQNGFYSPNELKKEILYNENWQSSEGKANTTENFTNKSGQLLLKRTYTKENGQDIAHDTYYIYDDFGNLTYVLSPKASDAIITSSNTIDTQVLNDLGYQYKYDYRNRLIEKRIPGKGWESIVYDQLDRPVLTQDPNLQAQGKWLFTKYDALGRVTYTGMYTSAQTRDQLQTTINAITTGFNESRIITPINYTDVDVYYTNDTFPNTNIEVLTVNYYDDYNFGNPDVLLASDDVTLSPNHMSQVGNVITKSYQSTAWNAGFTTNEKITGDGYIEYTITHNDKRLMLGLSKDSNIDTTFHYGTIDYTIDTGHTDNYVRVWENGTGISTGITCLPGDVFRIERIGTAIHYKKNGITFYQSAVPSTGDLTGDSSFLNHLSEVTNVKIVHTINGQVITGNTQGLATGSVVRVLGTDKFIHTVTQYDEKARATYMASKNEYLDTHDVVTTTYDFVGNVLSTNTSHTKSGVAFGTVSSVLTNDIFTYDHQNRLLTHTQTIDNGSPEVLVENHYDELGQLVQKKTGVTTHDISSTITNINRVVQEGNTISKVVTDAWDGNFETEKNIPSNKDGYIEFTITETGKYNMIGLSNPADPLGNGYAEIDYAIYTGSGTFGSDIRIYEEGTQKYIPYQTFQPGDTFKVERIINPTTTVGEVKYYKNGIVFYTSSVPSNTTLIGDASLGKKGSYVKDVRLVTLNPDAGQSLQTVDYAYNVRGWLKQINDPSQSLTNDVFAFKINYNTPETTLGAAALYNGNISETLWRTASDDELHAYGYTYDALNRIASANYAQGNTHNVNTGFYNLNSISYDKNGNILALQRNGADATHTSAVSIDDLVYGYADNSNKLTRVTDSTINTEGFNDNYQNSGSDPADNDYLYDDNGNMILDKNKYITNIEYNHLNLPTKVTFSNQTGGSAANTIEYIYDATGIKQEKLVTTDYGSNVEKHGTQYAGNYVYSGADTNGQGYFFYGLEFFNHPEGYIEPYLAKGTTLFRYTYQHKDHLGNIRVAYADYDNDGKIDIVRSNGAGNVDVDGDGDLENEIVQAKNYYPFGLQIQHGANNALSTINGRNHKYGYNGKEEQDELGLNWSDYGARNYDVALGRWMNIDNYSESFVSETPYQYTLNNPIYFIDPDGNLTQGGHQTTTGFIPPANHSYANGTFWKDNEGVWQWDSENQTWEGQTAGSNSMQGSDNYISPAPALVQDDGSGNVEGKTFATVGEVAADNAKDRLGSNAYNYEVANGEFAKGSDKCNQFVCNAYEDAGNTGLRKENGNIQDTGTLTNGADNLNGFQVVATMDANGGDLSSVQAGDVISGRRPTGTGHVEIATGAPDSNGNIPTIGATGNTVGTGWRPKPGLNVNKLPKGFTKITVRRYVENKN